MSLLFVVTSGFAQDNSRESLSEDEIQNNRSKFIKLSFGMSNSLFRDFATSPLFYKGLVKNTGLAFERSSSTKEREFGFNFLAGNYKAIVSNHEAISETKSATLYYSKLVQSKRLSSKKMNFKLGALVFATGNLRGNHDLQNNGRGIESFHSLMGSAKMSFDVSRTELKEKKCLFIKYRLNPRKRVLSFRFNVGLINSFFRNGYAYGNQDGILQGGNQLEGYKFHLFAGQSYSTALDYTWYLKNHNAYRFTYQWNAYTTNEEINKFDMAHHVISWVFLFNTNNK